MIEDWLVVCRSDRAVVVMERGMNSAGTKCGPTGTRVYTYVQKKSKIRTAKVTATVFPSSNGSLGFLSYLGLSLYTCTLASRRMYFMHAVFRCRSLCFLADLPTHSQKANLSPLCASAPRFFSYTK